MMLFIINKLCALIFLCKITPLARLVLMGTVKKLIGKTRIKSCVPLVRYDVYKKLSAPHKISAVREIPRNLGMKKIITAF